MEHEVYAWGKEALARAAAEHKPLRITIGTAADPLWRKSKGGTVARLTARYFVPVQVDGQAQPHVAEFYGGASALLTGRRELPLEVLADPQGKPFFAAGPLREVELAGLLTGVALHWNSDPSAYERVGEAMCSRLQAENEAAGENCHFAALWEGYLEKLKAQYDAEHGGFTKGAKHLQPQNLLFLLAYACYTGEELPLKMAEHTLRSMLGSSVRDQLGGGFFRGTKEADWSRPIPEKRLIDQAWMLDVCTRAWELTREELYRRAAVETADFVIRELRSEEGGFYTAQWADEAYYGMAAEAVEQAAREAVSLQDLRMRLYRERLQRGTPKADSKILVGHNGVMIAALARCGRILGVERYLTAAANGEAYLRSRLVTNMDLRRYACHSCAVGDGVLEDYAGYAMALLELYRCGCGGEYLHNSARVMARADALFTDHGAAGYFLCRGEGDLPLRPKRLWDERVPSAWSVALKVLGDLAKEVRHPGLRKRSDTLLKQAAHAAQTMPCPYALVAMMGQE